MKFEPKYLGARCNVPYLYPMTVVGFLKDKKLVEVQYQTGNYNHVRGFVPEEDVVVKEKDYD